MRLSCLLTLIALCPTPSPAQMLGASAASRAAWQAFAVGPAGATLAGSLHLNFSDPLVTGSFAHVMSLSGQLAPPIGAPASPALVTQSRAALTSAAAPFLEQERRLSQGGAGANEARAALAVNADLAVALTALTPALDDNETAARLQLAAEAGVRAKAQAEGAARAATVAERAAELRRYFESRTDADIASPGESAHSMIRGPSPGMSYNGPMSMGPGVGASYTGSLAPPLSSIPASARLAPASPRATTPTVAPIEKMPDASPKRQAPRVSGAAEALAAGKALIDGVLNKLGLFAILRPREAARRKISADPLLKDAAISMGIIEDLWLGIDPALAKRGKKSGWLVIFEGETDTACGKASSGAFYCPADEKLYLSFSFWNNIALSKLRVAGMSRFYVLAHEYGHHIQKHAGVIQAMNAAWPLRGTRDGNRLEVMKELHADSLAGFAAAYAKRLGLEEHGDIEATAETVWSAGDDQIYAALNIDIHPDDFNHGSAKQRLEWFVRGYKARTAGAIDPFNDPELRKGLGPEALKIADAASAAIARLPATTIDALPAK